MDQSFWQQHGNEISAAITILIAILIAVVVDRLVFGRAEAAAARVDTQVFSRAARTRLRVFRRLLFVLIILIGVALALSQFAEIKRLATGVLASTAVLGIVIGFAARNVIANAVAGVLMAITQPLRIGDLVRVEESEGRVVDIALTYTSIDSDDGKLIVVPNEKLTSNVVINRSAGSPRAPVVVEIWIPAASDIGAAKKAVAATGADSVTLTELTVDGARLELKTERQPGRDRAQQEAELRELAQDALRQAGVLTPVPSPS
ncbi:MAG: mechanosensitive ion channel family protein [Solirubrobacterales bacterium]